MKLARLVTAAYSLLYTAVTIVISCAICRYVSEHFVLAIHAGEHVAVRLSFCARELYEVNKMVEETTACKVENFKHTWQMNGRVTRTAFQLRIFSVMMSIGSFLRMRYGQQRVQSSTYIQSSSLILLWTIEHTMKHLSINTTYRPSRASSGIQNSFVCLTKPVMGETLY